MSIEISKYFPIGERLKQERKRLGFNQSDFAAIGEATRKTQYNYECGERPPDGGYLAAIAAIGADVLYILTGTRSGELGGAAPANPTLSRRQLALLDNLAHCAEEDRAAIERIALNAKKAQQAALTQPWDGKDICKGG